MSDGLGPAGCILRGILPYGDHVVVHLLQLLLGDIERVWRGVELVCLEGLVRETDLEGLVIRLRPVSHLSAAAQLPPHMAARSAPTCGTFSLSVCDEAASVVTLRKAGRVAMGDATPRRSGDAMLRLNVRDSMAIPVSKRVRGGRW
jgi:hypothetical protein